MKNRHQAVEDDFFALAKPYSQRKHKKKRIKVNEPEPTTTTVQPVIVQQPVPVPVQPAPVQPAAAPPPVEPPSRSFNITPPPCIDKESLKSYFELQLRSTLQDPALISDDDDDEDIPITQVTPQVPMDDSLEKYSFRVEHELKRPYLLSVRSKLPLPPDFDPLEMTTFGIKGTKVFQRILEQIIKYFYGSFQQRLAPSQLALYDANQTTLVWVDGRIELKPFYKPLTLRIPPPSEFDLLANSVESMEPTQLICLLIPMNHRTNFQSLYPEFSKLTPPVTEIPSLPPVPIAAPVPEAGPVPAHESGGYFVIGLKGKDNKRFDIEVSAKTRLSSILEHYIKAKKIDPNNINGAKLIFDDEEMDLNLTVGDTELEEDFEVQVVC